MLKNFFSKKDKIIYILYQFLQDILSPKYCLYCFKKNKNYICENCLKNLGFEIVFSCFECGRRIANKLNKCPIKYHSSLIKLLISASDYENKFLKNLILLGKNGVFEIFSDFGYYLGKKLKKYNFNDYFLTPIPLTKRKLVERGFSQTEILTKSLSKELSIPIKKIIKKTKETKDQASLNYEERLTNLNNAFEIKSDFIPQKIILVDDIKTTGSTLKETAKTLKKAGVKEIIALTILR